jgi:predicted MFS family arabinose efflux permease
MQKVTLPAGFNRLAWSNLAAQSAEQIALASAPIVAVIMLGAGEAETGLLQTALTLPFLVFSIPAGVLADRVPRRLLMAGAEAVRAISLAVLVLAIQFGTLSLPLMGIAGFVAVCGTIAFSVAAPSIIPALVPPNALPVANARIELARTMAFTAGPSLGGILVGWIGGEAAFAFAAALSLTAVGLLWGLKEPPRKVVKRQILHDIAEGAAFVFRSPLLAPILICQVIYNTSFFLTMAIYAPYAVHDLGLGASEVGITLGMAGVGMLCGALLAPRIMSWVPFGKVIAFGPIGGVMGSTLLAMTAFFPSPWLAGFAFFVQGVCSIQWVIGTTTLRQSIVPHHMLGRVSAIHIMAFSARPVGALIGAVIGGLYGGKVCLFAAAAGFGLQAILMLMSPTVRLKRQPEMVAA